MDNTDAAEERWDLISRPGDSAPQQSAMDKLLGNNGPRYQLWPERFVRRVVSGAVSGATLPRDAIEYELERAREFRRTGRLTMSDSDAGPENVGRLLDLAALGMPINPAARAGDSAIAGAKPGMSPVPTRRALGEAAERERLKAANNPAAWDAHLQRASGNEAAAEQSRRIAKEFHEASTGANPGKSIPDKANALLLDNDFLRGLSKEEINQLELMAKGTWPGRISGGIAKVFGAHDPDLLKAEAALAGGVGAAIGSVTGGPVGAGLGLALGAVPPIVGKSFQGMQNISGGRQLQNLEELSRMDSPLYRDMLKSAPRGNTVNDLHRGSLLKVPLLARGSAPRDDKR